MATHTVITTPEPKQFRYFKCFYECVECTRVGSEWTCERVTLGPDWCPNCELEADPYASEALFDECEYDAEDEDEPELTELDPDRLREDRDERLHLDRQHLLDEEVE